MTRLELLDTAINAWVAIDSAISQYGPGLAVAVSGWITVRAARRIRDHIAYRRNVTARRQALAAERQQMTDLRHAIDTAPLIPTQPGRDDDLLVECWNAWTATARKEKP